MKHNILMFLSLCILCISCSSAPKTLCLGCDDESQTELSAKDEKKPYLSREDAQVLSRISGKTLDKIHKGLSLDLSDVVSMQHAGIQADTMIQVILFTNSKFTLTTAEIIKLQSEGVSFKVINFMIRT